MSASNRLNGHARRTPGNGRTPVALAVRPAGASDAVPLGFFFDAVLRKDYFLRRGQLADMLRSPYHQVFVAEIDTILVGIAIQTRGTRLVNVLVHPGYRGLGIGRALVQHSGATEVRVKLDMSTGDPRGFYAALGFEPAGRTPGNGHIEVMRRRGRTVAGEQTKRVPTSESKAR
jgi:GNAT superfamily N-acetyltransferase